MTKVQEQSEENSHESPLTSSWENLPFERIAADAERQMFVGEKMMICRLKFAPGAVAQPHSHPHEQMTIVEKGKAKFLMGDEEIIVSAGDVLRFPPNIWHGATMLDEEVILVDIFTPLREDFLQKD